MKKVAVIGAGPAGLVSAKYCVSNGYECVVYEQRGDLAGTWCRDDKDEHEHENLVYTTLYQGVITNIPKEIMMYPDYSYPPEEDRSFLEPDDVFNYFQGYANTFNLHPYMKYHRLVLNVTTNLDEKWSVTVKNLKTKVVETFIYDYVFVCSGHLWDPLIPQLPGRELFKGTEVHSNRYYEPSSYKDRRVVVVGAHSSARDITHFISLKAKHVFVSHHGFCMVKFENNVSGKPLITELREHTVIFDDGTEEEVDDIVYCTGYNYTYPFLSNDCGITVEDKHVNPLYHHIVNINHPTMYFIGVPFIVCAIPLFDLQVRFCMAIINGSFKLPSKKVMLEDLKQEMVAKYKLNVPKRNLHRMGEFQEAYWKSLADAASIKPLPPALCRLYEESRLERKLNLRYRVIDDENFEVYTI